ncbi:MAG TPA: PEP-CTERM sorting domain-containing protein [Vicinamibacterales bacterium]|nr:PEP-CTERM sorting domain-containing protein [Vicinamibacterales bacterium]
MKQRTKLVLLVAALATAHFGVATAAAATITWHWEGTVTGHTDARGGPSLETVVPLGTPVGVTVTFDPDAPDLNPGICLQGTASASLRVLDRTFTGGGFVWEDAMGFGPGMCAPSVNNVEIVVPSWGFNGPALPDGWIPFVTSDYLPGLWWAGDLVNGQPQSISSQFPLFYLPRQSFPQRFTADLHAVPSELTPVPEPATWLLLSTGFSVAAACRSRNSRRASGRRRAA